MPWQSVSHPAKVIIKGIQKNIIRWSNLPGVHLINTFSSFGNSNAKAVTVSFIYLNAGVQITHEHNISEHLPV